uniref:DNA-directed RNA polymerase III 25 kD polypeptide n=1 Tax=Rhizophora mucronata TaxID=61149 RepID=A0A2P2L9E0_RHIMU
MLMVWVQFHGGDAGKVANLRVWFYQTRDGWSMCMVLSWRSFGTISLKHVEPFNLMVEVENCLVQASYINITVALL